jgi:tRNA A-37 threonylcarbamoyl transferase component Bud32/predicted nucleotidyltransferase
MESTKMMKFHAMQERVDIKELAVQANLGRTTMIETLDKEKILSLCKEVAGLKAITAVCLYGSWVCGYARPDSDLDVLLVLDNYENGVKYEYKQLNNIHLAVLVVDRELFEHDVDAGDLGEFAAGRILTPYHPLLNPEYLWKQEVKLKKRVIKEALENLVLEYSKLATELLIEPVYFMLNYMYRRARIYPPLKYSYLGILREDLRDQNLALAMKGYLTALREMADDGLVRIVGNYVKIDETFLNATVKRKHGIAFILDSIEKATKAYIMPGYVGTLAPLTFAQELVTKLERELRTMSRSKRDLDDPREHLFLQTATGLITLREETTVADFVKKIATFGGASPTMVKRLGGVLNTVFLVQFQQDKASKIVAVKAFKDWAGYKWFPLALWTSGVQNFAIAGKERMSNEYTINRFLKRQGFSVPEIYHVSWKDKLLFLEYVKGVSIDKIVQRVMRSTISETEETLLRNVGEKIACVHRVGVALGDCKPENVILSTEGKIYLVDFEQASKTGNQVWDVAEFLFFSGFYAKRTTSRLIIRRVAESFIQGYLNAGGSVNNIRSVPTMNYRRIFSPFLSPATVEEISKACEQASP